MMLSGVKIGFAITGSHCTLGEVLPAMQQLKEEGAELFPILSPSVRDTDTRFGKAADLYQKVVEISGHPPITTIAEAEPIGPRKMLDLVLVAPCTGNTMAKLAQGISDTSVTMACKAQLRNNRPVVLAIATNDGLGTNARNLATLLNKRHIYFVPFGQDAPHTKETSLNARMSLIPDTIASALEQRQIQPLLLVFHEA
ncbi:MAG TPA: dipicolinate synthase subunit B [Bacillota bacterium]